MQGRAGGGRVRGGGVEEEKLGRTGTVGTGQGVMEAEVGNGVRENESLGRTGPVGKRRRSRGGRVWNAGV